MCGTLQRGERRKHGLQGPLQSLQVITWLVILSSMIIYACLCVPFFDAGLEFATYVGFYVLILVVGFTAFFRVSLSDPSHILSRSSTKIPASEGVADRVCPICQSTMTPTTKHCHHCRKCVDGFDHHCLYLNTCVGAANYQDFFVLIVCCTSLMFLQCCVTGGLVAGVYSGAEPLNTRIKESALSPALFVVLQLVLVTIPFAGFALILSLLLFHLWICLLGTSTYQWILDRRKEKEQKKQSAQEKAFLSRERSYQGPDKAELALGSYKRTQEREQRKREEAEREQKAVVDVVVQEPRAGLVAGQTESAQPGEGAEAPGTPQASFSPAASSSDRHHLGKRVSVSASEQGLSLLGVDIGEQEEDPDGRLHTAAASSS